MLGKWIKSFGIPEVPRDDEERAAAAAAAEEQLRQVRERQKDIIATVRDGRTHARRNHYTQRIYEAYGGTK